MQNVDLAAQLSVAPTVSAVPAAEGSDKNIYIHRLDQLFPIASGNKIYKLIGHLQAARRAGKNHLISFGGAWSNHVHALAFFAQHFNLRSTAIIRGLYVDIENPMLRDARAMGMQIQLISKQQYALRRDPAFRAQLRAEHPDGWLIPEGGDDAIGRLGARHLASTLAQTIPSGDTLVVASGTGATVRALAMGLQEQTRLVSALVVKDQQLARKLSELCQIPCDNFRLFDCSGLGYGRVDSEQLHGLERLYVQTGVLLDPLYNGKAWSLAQRLAQQGERVHLLHTGGVQGWRGLLSRGLLSEYCALARAATELSFK